MTTSPSPSLSTRNSSPVRVQVESVIVRDGALYVAVTDADRVIRITPDGTGPLMRCGPDKRPAERRRPVGGFMPRHSHPPDDTLDRDGRLYVADTGNGRVVRVERDGRLTSLLGTEARPRCSP